MHNWFECKINYEKAGEEGKRITEPYLVDALSFTEAEGRIIDKMRPFISGDFTITDIRRANFYETFLNDTGEKYYKAKIFLITLDEKSGTEKKKAVLILAQASTIHEAIQVLDEGFKGTLADYVIATVSETALMNVFPYELKKVDGSNS